MSDTAPIDRHAITTEPPGGEDPADRQRSDDAATERAKTVAQDFLARLAENGMAEDEVTFSAVVSYLLWAGHRVPIGSRAARELGFSE